MRILNNKNTVVTQRHVLSAGEWSDCTASFKTKTKGGGGYH